MTRVRRSVLVAVALVVVLAAMQLSTVQPAGAWAWSSRVDLGGKVTCTNGSSKASKVVLTVTRIDNKKKSTVTAKVSKGKYSARLAVPGSGVKVRAAVSCPRLGTYKTIEFTVKRAKVGYGQTRHFCDNPRLFCL